MKKIFIHQPDEFGCGHYRAKFPYLNCYESLRDKKCSLDIDTYLNQNDTNYDAYVFHRAPSETLVFHIDNLKKMGKKIAWQIDDDLWNIPSWMETTENKFLWGLDKVIELSDYLWVSTEYLAKKINLPEKTRILPNLVDYNLFNIKRELNKDLIRILWCGGISHQKDMEVFLEAMHAIIKEDKRVQFVFWGDIHNSLLEYERTYGTLKATCNKKVEYGESICYLDPLPFRSYYNMLQQIRPHIALLPLVDCEFNHSKSNLKYLEMTMSGAVCVASKVTPYLCIEHKKDGILVENTLDDWYYGITDLIKEYELNREFMLSNAKRKIHEKYSWQTQKFLWEKAFCELI
jgi:glycosyltransferase involved in cell wall biosynthesis